MELKHWMIYVPKHQEKKRNFCFFFFRAIKTASCLGKKTKKTHYLLLTFWYSQYLTIIFVKKPHSVNTWQWSQLPCFAPVVKHEVKQRCRNITTATCSLLTIARLLWKDLCVGRLLFITARRPIWGIACSWKIASKLPLLAAGTQRALTCRREDHRPTRNSFLFRWTGEKMRVHALKLQQSFVLL